MATTQSGGHSENSAGFVRAALYARASDPNQAKEGTIESQVLKEQISAAGHVLVKEYIDNDFSGPRSMRCAKTSRRTPSMSSTFTMPTASRVKW
jgi:hypothetical protein